jgi:hypothetical protein
MWSNGKFIKSMNEFFNIIEEAFKNPLPIKWITNNEEELVGLFYTNENVYKIICQCYGNNIWSYDYFFLDENDEFSQNLTNHGNDKFRVIPTSYQGMDYLHEQKNPSAIIFGAFDNSRGRKKLYHSYCQEFALKNNYYYLTKTINDRQLFVIYKTGINKDNLSNAVKSMMLK